MFVVRIGIFILAIVILVALGAAGGHQWAISTLPTPNKTTPIPSAVSREDLLIIEKYKQQLSTCNTELETQKMYIENNAEYLEDRIDCARKVWGTQHAFKFTQALSWDLQGVTFEDLKLKASKAGVDKEDNAYYVNEKGKVIKIGQSYRLFNIGEETALGGFRAAKVSPNGKFIAYIFIGWENVVVDIYDVLNQALYTLEESEDEEGVFWLKDGKLRIEGSCGMGISCGIFESETADKPWILKRISDYPQE